MRRPPANGTLKITMQKHAAVRPVVDCRQFKLKHCANIQNMDTWPFSQGHARIGSGYQSVPKTPSDWLQYWATSKHMHVPGTRGHDVVLEIADIAPSDRADALVRAANGKQFYVEFQRSKIMRARELPVFVVPDCNPEKGWWLLPNEKR